MLKDSKEQIVSFPRGTVKNLLMRERNIKDFSHIHLWHDNSKGGWYCETIILKNLMTNKLTYFHVRDWLSVEHGSCMTDKIVPAEPDDKNFEKFSDLFRASLWTKICDDHLWISVFYRGFKSSFNRTQRWTCCFVLVFITFVANCMWFETGKRQNPILTFGPIEMTGSQIWASIAAALVAVPPITFIILMFQRTESAEDVSYRKLREQKRLENRNSNRPVSGRSNRVAPKNPSAAWSDDTDAVNNYSPSFSPVSSSTPLPNRSISVTSGYDDHSIEQEHLEQAECQLPRWTLWIWYTYSFIGMILGAFFTILYSMDWGKEKSERWLTNALASFFLDILILQPINGLSPIVFLYLELY